MLRSNKFKGDVFMIGKNVAVIYGGGQIPSGNIVLGRMIERLLKRNLNVYGVHKSFWGLADPSCYEEFTLQQAKQIQDQIGTYLSTCRKVNPADDQWFHKIFSNLKERDVKTIILPGGDGSSRAGNVLSQRARKEGYNLQVVFLPCTIDGIEGSDTTIGIDSAVAESYRQSSLTIANAFATFNPTFMGPRIAINEIQGRNRNDIAVALMDQILEKGKIGKYSVDDIDLIFIPAGYDWSYHELIKRITSTGKETAIIVSEGARPREYMYWDSLEGKGVGEKLERLIKTDGMREVNLNLIGYLSQTNDQIFDGESKKIQDWICFAVKAMYSTNDSIAIIKSNGEFRAVPLKEFAGKTDSDRAIPLKEEEVTRFKRFLP